MELTHGESSGKGSSGTLWKHLSLCFIATPILLMVAPGTVESYHSAEKWVRRSQRPHPIPTYALLVVSKALSWISSLDIFLSSRQSKIVPRPPAPWAIAFFSTAPGSHSLLCTCLHRLFFSTLNKLPPEPCLHATSCLVFFLWRVQRAISVHFLPRYSSVWEESELQHIHAFSVETGHRDMKNNNEKQNNGLFRFTS